jgi:hypothetical protein
MHVLIVTSSSATWRNGGIEHSGDSHTNIGGFLEVTVSLQYHHQNEEPEET